MDVSCCGLLRPETSQVLADAPVKVPWGHASTDHTPSLGGSEEPCQLQLHARAAAAYWYIAAIEAVYLALRWPVVGEIMGWSTPRKRWIGLLGGREGRNQRFPGDAPAVFGPQSLKSEYIPYILRFRPKPKKSYT